MSAMCQNRKSYCKLVYQAKQVRSSEQIIGCISCVKCRTTVHSCADIYDFSLVEAGGDKDHLS